MAEFDIDREIQLMIERGSREFYAKAMAKNLSGMILDGIAEGIRYDYRKDEEFFLTPEILHREALAVKAQQVESCWEWHTDPEGAFDRAETRFWASLP